MNAKIYAIIMGSEAANIDMAFVRKMAADIGALFGENNVKLGKLTGSEIAATYERVKLTAQVDGDKAANISKAEFIAVLTEFCKGINKGWMSSFTVIQFDNGIERIEGGEDCYADWYMNNLKIERTK
jgi:hypothetical protein